MPVVQQGGLCLGVSGDVHDLARRRALQNTTNRRLHSRLPNSPPGAAEEFGRRVIAHIRAIRPLTDSTLSHTPGLQSRRLTDWFVYRTRRVESTLYCTLTGRSFRPAGTLLYAVDAAGRTVFWYVRRCYCRVVRLWMWLLLQYSSTVPGLTFFRVSYDAQVWPDSGSVMTNVGRPSRLLF